MIGRHTKMLMAVTIVTLATIHVIEADCKVGDRALKVGEKYTVPPPNCTVYMCGEGDKLTSNTGVCRLLAFEEDCCKYGYETKTVEHKGCNCKILGCKQVSWYTIEYFKNIFNSACKN